MFRLWLRLYLNIGLFFFFNRIIVTGKENIPRKGPVIFVANHQNAILDGALIATSTYRTCHFLSRADIFQRPLVVRLLSLINSLPVYRIRDGFRSLTRNDNTFKKCFDILAQNECIIIFPEGQHSLQRRLRKLNKGFARIVLGAIKNHPSMNIAIVPVGINYAKHQKFGSDVHLIFGQPIDVDGHNGNLQAAGAIRLTNDVSSAMKELITHIDDGDRYETILIDLERVGPNYLDPASTNRVLRELAGGIRAVPKTKTKALYTLPLKPIALLPNIIPLLIWRLIAKRITDDVFVGSAKFCTGISIFPLVYILQSVAVGATFNEALGLAWFLWSIPSMKLLRSA